METKEVKLYVQAIKYSWQDDFEINITTMKRLTDAATVAIDLSEVTIEVPIPPTDQKKLRLEEVEQLSNLVRLEKANSYARITEIKEKIQSLLCIEQGE